MANFDSRIDVLASRERAWGNCHWYFHLYQTFTVALRYVDSYAKLFLPLTLVVVHLELVLKSLQLLDPLIRYNHVYHMFEVSTS